MAIEEADSRDIPAMTDLLADLFRLESDFEPDREKQLRAVRLILAHPEKGRLFVVRVGGKVVGMASVLFTFSTAEGGPVVLLEDVVLAEPFRGQGLGRGGWSSTCSPGCDRRVICVRPCSPIPTTKARGVSTSGLVSGLRP